MHSLNPTTNCNNTSARLVSKMIIIPKMEGMIEGYYSIYSTFILEGYLEMARKAVLDSAIVAGHGSFLQKSTICTTMDLFVHGRDRPLMHRIRYFRPHAPPLSHKATLTAPKRPSEGN